MTPISTNTTISPIQGGCLREAALATLAPKQENTAKNQPAKQFFGCSPPSFRHFPHLPIAFHPAVR
jgi:hypothetical protein